MISKAFARWSTDPNLNNPISIAASARQKLIVVSDRVGDAIIAWNDTRRTKSNYVTIAIVAVNDMLEISMGFTLDLNY
jgi:hypothetical protein